MANKQLTDAVEQLSNGIRGQVLIEKGSEVEIQLSQTIINISTYSNKNNFSSFKSTFAFSAFRQLQDYLRNKRSDVQNFVKTNCQFNL